MLGNKLHAARQIVSGWARSNGLIVAAAVMYTLADGRRVDGLGAATGDGAWVAVMVGLGAWVAYLVDRLVDPPQKGAGAVWARRHRGVSWVACLLSVIAGAWVFVAKLPPRAEWVILAAGALSVGYALPCWGWRGRWRRLREVPYMKSVWVALGWALATSAAPMLAAGAPSPATIEQSLERFVFILAGVIPFDVPDLKQDRRDGIKTIPMRLGVSGTVIVCWVLLAVFIWRVMQSSGNSAMALANVLPAVLLALWLLGLRAKKTDAYYSVGIDGLVALQALAMLIALSL